MGKHTKRQKSKINIVDKVEEVDNVNIVDRVEAIDQKNDEAQIPKTTFIDRYDWEKYSYLAGIITVFITGGYFIVNNIYTIIYQKDCEDFYKIPGKYFYGNIDNKITYVIVLILCLFLFFSPAMIKKFMQKQNRNNKIAMYIYIIFLTLLLGMEFGLINTLNLVTVLNKINTFINIPNGVITWINNHASLIMWLVVIFATLTIISICLIREVSKIKYKKIRAVVNLIGFISYIITVALFAGAAGIKLTYNIKDKLQYETATIDNRNMVVLSSVDDKFLVVEYTIKDGKTTFITNKYMLVDNCNIMISYKEFESMPQIVSNSP